MYCTQVAALPDLPAQRRDPQELHDLLVERQVRDRNAEQQRGRRFRCRSRASLFSGISVEKNDPQSTQLPLELKKL